jgi:anti-sigma-K factor RskA
MAASLLLAVQLAVRGPTTPTFENERYLAVLQSPTEKSTGWLVEATAGEGVRLVPVGDPVPPPPGKSLQLWTKPNGAKGPTSLGLVKPGQVAIVPLAQLPSLGEKQLFEVTLEPEGGSTIGKPPGPVLYVGTTVHL